MCVYVSTCLLCVPPHTPPLRRSKRYISAHWSPTGRWLRKHVQERDSQRGVEGLFREETLVRGYRQHITHAASPASDPDRLTFTERLHGFARSVMHIPTLLESAYSHTSALARTHTRTHTRARAYRHSHTLPALQPSALSAGCAGDKSSTQNAVTSAK